MTVVYTAFHRYILTTIRSSHKTSKRCLRKKKLFAMQRAGAAMAYAATRRMKKPSAHHSGGTGSFEIMMNWKCPSAFSEKKAAL